jgi:hypothetical protein
MSSDVAEALRDLAGAFATCGVRWYLFGAQAAIVYGATRVTEDIDVTVDLEGTSAKALVSALAGAGFDLRVEDAEGFVEKTRVLPLVHAATALPVDVVIAGPGIEELFFARLRRHEREGQAIPVASAEDLIVMKVLAGRPHDEEDVRAVVRALGPTLDVAAIEETLRLLEQALDQRDLLPAFRRLLVPSGGAPGRPSPRGRRRPR